MLSMAKIAFLSADMTKPYEVINEEYNAMMNGKNIKFIDCLSHAAGISNEISNCKYIESPSQLENILLEI